MVVGSVNADLVLEIDRLPADGETLGAKSLNTFPGGKASRRNPWTFRSLQSSHRAQHLSLLHGLH